MGLLRRIFCSHDFRVQPRRGRNNWWYDCHHKCGAVHKGPPFQYDYNNIEAEREKGR